MRPSSVFNTMLRCFFEITTEHIGESLSLAQHFSSDLRNHFRAGHDELAGRADGVCANIVKDQPVADCKLARDAFDEIVIFEAGVAADDDISEF